MKNKFNSDGDLPLKKTPELSNIIIVGRSIFTKDKKYYPKVF